MLDGVGVGELPDAADYGDAGSNSLANTARAVGGLRLPNMARLGLGNIVPIEGVDAAEQAIGCWARMAALSPGKDSTSGHWELMGCVLSVAFPTYDDGFPDDLVEDFCRRIGRGVLGNCPASGTEIIERLGAEHMKTGKPILYTSQDSVFQIAAHEEIIPVEELYRMCEEARAILVPPHNVARVIARPFVGEPGRFRRTPRRRDFSLEPPCETVLDALAASGRNVIGIGKIDDLFAHRGLTEAIHTKSNSEGMDRTLEHVSGGRGDFIFTNLVDFDMMWGHRNDARAYAVGLEEFDSFLGELLAALEPRDLLVMVSDHGCDPTTASTDHSREYVPLLVYHKRLGVGRSLGVRRSLADVGKSIAENFSLPSSFPGESFLEAIGGRDDGPSQES